MTTITDTVSDTITDTITENIVNGVPDIALPTNPNLVYMLDSVSGATLVDASANNNDGTISGAATIPGIIGDGLDYDGTNDYTEMAASGDASLDLTTFSWCGWITQADTPSGADTVYSHRLTSVSPGNGNNSGFQLLVLPGRTIELHTPEGGKLIGSTTLLTLGTPYFIVITSSGFNGTAEIFVNGVSEDSASWPTGYPKYNSNIAGNPVRFAMARTQNLNFNYANQDQSLIRYFNIELTQQNIDDLYNLGAGN